VASLVTLISHIIAEFNCPLTVGDPEAEAALKNGCLVMISDATLANSSLVGYLDDTEGKNHGYKIVVVPLIGEHS
jgi:hypothetical protein